MRYGTRLILFTFLLLVPAVSAVDFTEDFEGFQTSGILAVEKPTSDWYIYSESSDYGVINTVSPIAGVNDFKFSSNVTATPTDNRGTFALNIPTQINSLNFTLKGTTVSDNGLGSQQFVILESRTPVRELVSFYIFCNEGDACELRVKFQHSDTTGQVLINHTVGLKTFTIELDFLWVDNSFCLEVNDVDDGCFTFTEVPGNFWRFRVGQYRGEYPSGLQVDDWMVTNAIEGDAPTIDGDITEGFKNFAHDINIRSTASLFLFGIILMVTILMAVFLPMSAANKSNTIASTVTFVMVLSVFWLVEGGFWPDWVGISLIILTGAMIGTFVRTVALGMKDASNGAALVAGSLGYFIITTTLLGFSGYATETIQLPTENPVEVNETGEPQPVQGYILSGLECFLTGGVLTYGLIGDCSRYSETKFFSAITDIFGWIRGALTYLFQLLSLQLPIPVVFSMMIILPPATSLATYAFGLIRGNAS